MKALIAKQNDKTKTISFRISSELADRMESVRKLASQNQLELPVSDHLADQLERFVAAAERDLQAITKSTGRS